MPDAYVESLGKMIAILVNYKPGSITLENITRLCQTMGLESFVDQVSANISRLSIASKIIVIDIDYEVTDGKVIDVKLVLASNFDKFDYFNGEANILHRSLTTYSDLHEFHHNLKFLTLLDACSSIDIESNVSQFDLFEYYSMLPQYMQSYLDDNGAQLTVQTNLNDRFGIYLLDHSEKKVAKLTFAATQDPNQRYYEYKYSSETKEWINQSAESYTTGITLVFELLGDPPTYLPKDSLPPEHPDEGFTSASASELQRRFAFKCQNPRVTLVNDFTVDVYPASTFQLLNDNICLCFDILRRQKWWHTVLYPISQLLLHQGQDSAVGDAPAPAAQPPLHRRRSSNKGCRRASAAESATLGDENMHQLTLTEIMNKSVIPEDDAMMDDRIELYVNENYVYLGTQEGCSFYNDPIERWEAFVESLRQMLT
ncbi:ADL341Cp [Eremothecium gossypii ATCC 10895]|uniref:Mediator of RNA polymerase II transcription subunit 1 n=1 Tax=Eremothecium gossypii (strain ATCC 10895 / CBS 109.51 / FGSC 9923 / NRRL Y-1056) TaxID=284811 RepID=MED1_EREGS|nr:ADL341Cp [Eremothecium gossypii ATCC 10895]Q75BA8.1 RecName: Full=Mediator of RNA polymerase II transcription subunit 1; AltName: Full=Mediator complex subunit 1 [Eremothecium gossypii ATCC 10895]AAS51578.1 ADL341Cp [Eremothecium gossypii ATCC 10895]AEY95875.1 FADL341Cp [Eremothecium gossypii FDAG1]